MKKNLYVLVAALATLLSACSSSGGKTESVDAQSFLRVDGVNIVDESGNKFFIEGTNLGNWLNPEGYMFGFNKVPRTPATPTDPNSQHWINEMLCQLVGPEYAADFWRKFKENYITREDIDYLASTGINTLRLPFHYKLFTRDEYMGSYDENEGFMRIDSVLSWCRPHGIRLILDMHDAPGGQTGDNIDDSYGYPWLFVSEGCQQQFVEIWSRIADYYQDEPLILGYELINEPIAHYFEADLEMLNAQLEPLYMRATAAIRQHDTRHIVLWGGAQWNGNFKMFSHLDFDSNLLLTCHRYGQEPSEKGIQDFIQFRDSVGIAMYMGETGHNTNEWLKSMTKVMRDNNIGFTLWPYKKMFSSSFVGFEAPENWEAIQQFAASERGTYAAIRQVRPDQELARRALDQLLENCRFANCQKALGYIEAAGFKAE